jgi:hypothetical protein
MAFTRRTVAESVGLNHSIATQFQELTDDSNLASSVRYPCLLNSDSFLRQVKIVYLSFPTLRTSYRFATVPAAPHLNSSGGLEPERREAQAFV